MGRRVFTEHAVTDVRHQVYQAAEAAMEALQAFPDEIRALALRQLAVDAEIRNVAMSRLQAPAVTVTPIAPPATVTIGPVLFTLEQVAERCHVTVDAVKHWLNVGRLKRTKAGGKTLVSDEELRDFLKRSTEERPRGTKAAAA